MSGELWSAFRDAADAMIRKKRCPKWDERSVGFAAHVVYRLLGNMQRDLSSQVQQLRTSAGAAVLEDEKEAKALAQRAQDIEAIRARLEKISLQSLRVDLDDAVNRVREHVAQREQPDD